MRAERQENAAIMSSRETSLLSSLAIGSRGVVAWLDRTSPPMRALTAYVAGALSVLGLAPFFLSPILFLTLPLLVWLIDTAPRPNPPGKDAGQHGQWPAGVDRDAIARAGTAGWFFGLGYFMFGLFWVGEAMMVESEKFAWLLPASVTLLPAGLAVFFAAATALARAFWGTGFRRVLLLAALLAIAEWLRGHIFTGLPWNTLGYILTYPMLLMQSAGLVGIYGLTVAAVVAFAAPLVTLADAAGSASRVRAMSALSGVIFAAALLGLAVAYGAVRLAQAGDGVVAGAKLRLVQPSVPQRNKWQQDKQREIFDLHKDLSRHGPDGRPDDLAGITHVVWPEAAMPFLPLESPEALKEIAELLPDGVQLLTGALRVDRPGGANGDGQAPRHASGAPVQKRIAAYNSMMVFNASGGLNAVYDKIHLVPFGEYLPFQAVLESIGLEQLTRVRGGFVAGRSPRPVIDVAGLPPLIGLVCYEAIFPAAVVQGNERPALAINVTNDGWFGNTTGPRQHFHMARVRAVEEAIPIVRVANNGISAVIDSYGRVLGQLDMNVRGVIDSPVPQSGPAPLYARTGDLVFWGLICLTLIAARWRRPYDGPEPVAPL